MRCRHNREARHLIPTHRLPTLPLANIHGGIGFGPCHKPHLPSRASISSCARVYSTKCLKACSRSSWCNTALTLPCRVSSASWCLHHSRPHLSVRLHASFSRRLIVQYVLLRISHINFSNMSNCEQTTVCLLGYAAITLAVCLRREEMTS